MVNLFIEEFETKAMNSANHPPRFDLGIGMTVLSSKTQNKVSNFYRTSIELHIQFNKDTPDTEGSIPFLNTLVSPGPDKYVLTKIYRNLPA